MSQVAQPSILEYVQPRAPTGPTSADKTYRTLLAVILAVIIVLIVFIVYGLYRAAHTIAPRVLSRRLASRGWTVYLLKDCGYCNKQMALLEGQFRQFVLCDKGKVIGGYSLNPPLACRGIPGYPLWYNVRTREKRVGYQDAAALKHMAR